MSFWHKCGERDVGHGNATGEGGYLLVVRQDIVAYNLIVVCEACLSPLKIRSVGIVCQSTSLHARLDEFVDGSIHIELQDGRNIDVAFRMYGRD